MNTCPRCHADTRQVKAGRNASGSQRYQCQHCRCRYTPEPSQRYDETMRRQAVQFYVDGMSYRKIARHLGVDHVTVINWVKARVDQLPPAPLPAETPLHVVEMDELFTFVREKKTAFTS